MKKLSYMGLFLALALLCSYIESLIPFSFGIPGMKLGLTNIVILLVLYYLGTRQALGISVARVLLAGFMFGNAFSIIYSLAGGVLSLLVMAALKKSNRFHIVTISICGGIFHNLGQIIVAALVMENIRLFYYFLVLFACGAITGLVIGVVAFEVLKRTRRYFILEGE